MRLVRSLLALAVTIALLAAANVPPPRAPARISVEILDFPAPTAGPFFVRFTNHSDTPVRLLRPLDGSDCGWHLPFYLTELRGPDGELCSRGGRCGVAGLWDRLKWPDDYLITLAPGQNHDEPINLDFKVPHGGLYTAVFTYHYNINPPGGKGTCWKYPDSLWVGTVSTAPVLVDFEVADRAGRHFSVRSITNLPPNRSHIR